MNAYLFTGSISQVRSKSSCGQSGCADTGQVSDSCLSLVVYGDSAEVAQCGFEAWLRSYGDVNLISTTIAKVVAAPMLDQLFTEVEYVPIDWSKISEQILSSIEGIVVDDLEQGYWVDANQVVGPKNLSPDVTSLQRSLDEDIRSGLNWAAEKQFFFLISALSPPPPPPEYSDETEADPANSAEAQAENDYESEMENADGQGAMYPELVDKEVTLLIQARNSAVAVWLWRRYAASTRLKGNQIRIDPWCGALGLQPGSTV
jgi:hypothetical protein